MKFKEKSRRIISNALVLSDRKSLHTSKNIRFIIKTCRSTKPPEVFINVILKHKNVIKPSGVPYHLVLY